MRTQLSAEDIEIIYKNYELAKNQLIQDIRSDDFGLLVINYIQQLLFCLFLLPSLIEKELVMNEFNTSITIDEFFQVLNENKKNLKRNFFAFFSSFKSKFPEKIFTINSKKFKILFSDISDFIDSKLQLKDLENLYTKWDDFSDFIQRMIVTYGSGIIDSFSFIYERDLDIRKDSLADSQSIKINRLLTERRKRGVYYTPQKVTSYMNEMVIFSYLKNKLGIAIENFDDLKEISTPEELKKIYDNLLDIRILDLACGSGDFLIESAQQLFDIIIYLNEKLGLANSSDEIKKNILENNLYGVDLQSKAIFITRIRLWIWYINNLSKNKILQEFTPNQISNLRIGNSLIGWNNESEKDLIEKYSESVLVELNPFNWYVNFPGIFATGGFDIIIGNPPYIEIKKIRNDLEKKIYTTNYISAYKLYDISILFIERGLTLLKEGGILSFIITNKFLATDFGLKIRELLLTQTKIINLIDLSFLPIFVKTAAYPIIIAVEKSKTTNLNYLLENKIKLLPEIISLDQLRANNNIITIAQKEFYILPRKVISISSNFHLIQLINQLTDIHKMVDLGKFDYRLLGFTNWINSLEKLSENKTSDKDLLFIGTTNVENYFINYKKELTLAKRRLKNHYLVYDDEFTTAWKTFLEPKLLFREIAKKLTVAIDPGKFANATGIYMFTPKNKELMKFLLLVLNSELLNNYYSVVYTSTHMSGGYLRFNASYLKQLPIVLPEDMNTLTIFDKLADCILLLNYIQYHEILINPEIKQQIDFFVEIVDLLIIELYFGKFVKTNLMKIIQNPFMTNNKLKDIFGTSNVIDFTKYAAILKTDFYPLVIELYNSLKSNDQINIEKEKIIEFTLQELF
ncbi:MAG: N-6 DNA methylase [Asgard group archaeon]|nr:N-6 DNA methylase [Asgard group archaeon]